MVAKYQHNCGWTGFEGDLKANCPKCGEPCPFYNDDEENISMDKDVIEYIFKGIESSLMWGLFVVIIVTVLVTLGIVAGAYCLFFA